MSLRRKPPSNALVALIAVTSLLTLTGCTKKSNAQYTVPGEISLLSKDVAQVPRHVFTWEARYWNPSPLLLSVQGRFRKINSMTIKINIRRASFTRWTHRLDGI